MSGTLSVFRELPQFQRKEQQLEQLALMFGSSAEGNRGLAQHAAMAASLAVPSPSGMPSVVPEQTHFLQCVVLSLEKCEAGMCRYILLHFALPWRPNLYRNYDLMAFPELVQ